MGTQAWLGDVLTTCYGDGRNRLFGELIGSGYALLALLFVLIFPLVNSKSVEEALRILDSQKKRAEGYLTTKEFLVVAKVQSPMILVHNTDGLKQSKGVKAPILKALVKVLFQGGDVRECVRSMFASPSAL